MADLPEVPDLAVISLGRERVVDTAAECAQHGIKRLVVISQGFATTPGAPNCRRNWSASPWSTASECWGPIPWGSSSLLRLYHRLYRRSPDLAPSPLTMVAQSGAFQVGASSFTGRLGKAIDVGNACDLDMVDVLDIFGK